MDDTSPAPNSAARAVEAPAAPDVDRLPWAALLVLGAAAFVMVTAEMLPMAMLPQLAVGLGRSESEIGLLVSIWALVVVVGTFPAVRLVRRFDRRAVIAWALVALAVATVLAAAAPSWEAIVVARLIGAVSVGLLWATSNAATADLVPERDLPSAVAVVLGGAMLGTVIGTPLAGFVAQAVGWRPAFWGLAALALAAAVAVRMLVPALPAQAAEAEAAGVGVGVERGGTGGSRAAEAA
ncbi:MFS transporter, partial [Agromyces seonyuensis]